MWFNYHHGATLGMRAARRDADSACYNADTGGTTLTCRDTHPCGIAHLDTSACARYLYSAAQCTLTSNTRAPPLAGPDPMGSGTTSDTSVQRRPPQSGAQPPPRPDLSFLTLNVGGPFLSRRRTGHLLAEIIAEQPAIIALQEFRFRSGSHHAAWIAAMDGDYLPITYGDENPDTQFLVHNSISRYVSKLPSMKSQARAIKIALPGHTPYITANIHGPFLRDQREKLDEWLAQLPDLGILMGDFNDCVWGRPSQPTFPPCGSQSGQSHSDESIGTAAGAAADHWQCVALALLVIPQVFAPHVPMFQGALG